MSYSKRLADAEDALDACAIAFELIPLWAFRRGHTWHPSDEAIALLEEARDALIKYAKRHPATNGNGKK